VTGLHAGIKPGCRRVWPSVRSTGRKKKGLRRRAPQAPTLTEAVLETRLTKERTGGLTISIRMVLNVRGMPCDLGPEAGRGQSKPRFAIGLPLDQPSENPGS
jgi:hypothetical protein